VRERHLELVLPPIHRTLARATRRPLHSQIDLPEPDHFPRLLSSEWIVRPCEDGLKGLRFPYPGVTLGLRRRERRQRGADRCGLLLLPIQLLFLGDLGQHGLLLGLLLSSLRLSLLLGTGGTGSPLRRVLVLPVRGFTPLRRSHGLPLTGSATPFPLGLTLFTTTLQRFLPLRVRNVPTVQMSIKHSRDIRLRCLRLGFEQLL
jgi:hypothetical protein